MQLGAAAKGLSPPKLQSTPTTTVGERAQVAMDITESPLIQHSSPKVSTHVHGLGARLQFNTSIVYNCCNVRTLIIRATCCSLEQLQRNFLLQNFNLHQLQVLKWPWTSLSRIYYPVTVVPAVPVMMVSYNILLRR